MRCALAALFLLTLPSCSEWFFSGERWIDQTKPVALVETVGGVEFGATTEFGILTLGRSAAAGPCRVHYFLGDTPLIESGELLPTGSVFTRAEIDLKTQMVRALDRAPAEGDELWVMWTADGRTVRRVGVDLPLLDGVAGDLLLDPGESLPAGAAVLTCGRGGEVLFVGLIAGRATLEGVPHAGRYYVFAGVDRLRELLAVPQPYPVDHVPKYRLDDIVVTKPDVPTAVKSN